MASRDAVMLAQAQKPLPNTENLPAIKLRNPAAEFIDNRIDSDDHRAFSLAAAEPRSRALDLQQPVASASGPVTNISNQDADVVTIYRDADVQQQLFLQALEQFEQDQPEKYRTRFDIRGKHDWNEVIQEAQVAEMKYKKKGSDESPFSKIRGCFRSLQRRSDSMKGWLELIPSQNNYASTLTGGIKLIIRSATRMNAVREFIFTALAAIPDEIEKAQLAIAFSYDMTVSIRLHKRIAEMYTAILQILSHLVLWLERNSALKHIKAFFQQSDYEKVLEDKIDDFKQLVLLVKEEANLCASQRLQRIDHNVLNLGQNITGIDESIVDLTNRVDSFTNLLTEQHAQTNAEILEGISALKSLYGFLRSNPQLDPHTGQFVSFVDRRVIEAPARRRKAISVEALQTELGYDEEVLSADLTTTLRWGGNLDLRAQDRAVYMIQHPKLQSWLLSPNNSVLLLNGNEGDHSETAVHATSFISAHLINSVAVAQAQGRNMAVLYWFGSLHRNARKDPNSSIKSITGSLVSQLLAQYPRRTFDLYFIKRRHVDCLRDGDLETMLNILDELIVQLPEGADLLCVLDSVSVLEDAYRRADIHYLLTRLLQTAASPHPGGNKFKLLIINAGGPFRAASIVSEAVGEQGVLVLPETVDGEGMGFSRLRWNKNIQGAISNLGRKDRRKKATKGTERHRLRKEKGNEDEDEDDDEDEDESEDEDGEGEEKSNG